MTISARLQHGPGTDKRSSGRRQLRLDASVPGSGDAVAILDMSVSGMLIETDARLAPFDAFQIALPEAGLVQAVIVWSSGRFYGCQFNDPISRAAVSAAQLRSTPEKPTNGARRPRAPEPVITLAEDGDADSVPDERKASLTVRLRVLLGSTIALWALIIWAAGALFS